MGLRGLDLFCGAGGSSQGASAAGVRMVAAVDRCELATATYREMFPFARKNVITADLDGALGAELFDTPGRIDLLLASPECTNHSLARGNRPPCEVSRRSSLLVLKFIEDLAPDYLVLENVAMLRRRA